MAVNISVCEKSANHSQIPYSTLTINDDKAIVGHGTFGTVYKAYHKTWCCLVAYKRFHQQSIEEVIEFDQRLIEISISEKKIYDRVRHPNIVSMLGIVLDPGHVGFVSEYLSHGSLDCFLRSVTVEESHMSCVPSILKTRLALDVCLGMAYLHSLCPPVVHADLNMNNVLVGESFIAKLSDFGFTDLKRYLYSINSHSSAEVSRTASSHFPVNKWEDISEPLNSQYDVYSFSILLWELFTEKLAPQRLKDVRIPWTADCLPADVPKEIRTLITNCRGLQADQRPTFNEILVKLSPFVTGQTNEIEIRNAKISTFAVYYKNCRTVKRFSAHGEKLLRAHQTLCECVRRTDGILRSMREARAVTSQECDYVSKLSDVYFRTDRLVDVMSVKSAATYRCFLQALDDTGQPHLHRYLEDRDYKLSITHRTALIDNYAFLADNLSLQSPPPSLLDQSTSPLLDFLLERAVLNPQEVEMIRSRNSCCEAVDELLQCILRTSREQYDQFLESLKLTSHDLAFTRLSDYDKSSECLLSSGSFQSTDEITPEHLQALVVRETLPSSQTQTEAVVSSEPLVSKADDKPLNMEEIESCDIMRLYRWLGESEWARRYYDGKDGIHIGVRNKSKTEIQQLLLAQNFGRIPVKIFDVDLHPAEYKRTLQKVE